MYSLRDEYNSRLEGMYNILESSDIVTEFLSLKRKNKKVKQEYEIKMVESKIRKISAEINSFIRSNKEISKLINHGLRIYPYNEIYEAVRKRDKTETHYYSNTHFQYIFTNNPLSRKQANSITSLHKQQRVYLMPRYKTPLFI